MAMRVLLVVHRYLGVAVGLLMVLWCLSGFVMMYSGYPKLSEAAALRALQPVSLPASPAAPAIADQDRFAGFQVEMRDGRAVLRLAGDQGPDRLIDLETGGAPAPLDAHGALAVAARYATANGVPGPASDLGVIARDQWTVEDARRNGPVHHIRFSDPAGTELYIALRSGQVVQATTRATRFWGWLGAVPHWLYPTVLRQSAALWDAVVVWTSLVGCFLTLTGLYVGVVRFRPYRSGRWTPYRGWFYWHHITGLVFGLLTLTWVASGLMTMTPWGLLDTPVEAVQRARVAGDLTGAEIKSFLANVARRQPAGAVTLTAAPLGGQLYVIAQASDGASQRLDAWALPAAPPSPAAILAAIRRTADAPVVAFTRQTTEDAYYYSGYDGPVLLPAYRVQLADAQDTTLYVDPRTGEVIRALDKTARASRWLRTGLHDWDFGSLRRRPLWDAVVLFLLAGVTALCGVGAWLSLQRMRRDLAGLRLRKVRS